MKNKNQKFEQGQTLVLVTVMLLGMIAILALVLDGGNVYAQRRQAQSAADAGALAATRAYCLEDNEEQKLAAAISAAEDYVTRNQADRLDTYVSGENEVTVSTSITFDTYFLSVLGRPDFTVEAIAAAKCSNPGAGINILPIAWSCSPPDVSEDEVPEDDICDIDTIPPDPEGQGCNIYEGDPIYIIVDSKDIEEDVVCQPLVEGEDPDLDLYCETNPDFCLDCDIDDVGPPYENEIHLTSGGNRAWLDLDGGGGGANDLKTWIENGFSDPVVAHTWFAGQTGVDTSVFDAVYDYALDPPSVIVPLFDSICPIGLPEENCPELFHTDLTPDPPYIDNKDIVVPTGGSSTDYFHVIAFALFDITCVDAGSHPSMGKDGKKECEAHAELGLDPEVKTIEGCFVSGFEPDLSGLGEYQTDALTLYLTR
ncbi:MAG: Tad domain-containing protein [Anaerolineales bacterium]|jgi:type II secretory pathway pseudopilin PulG